MSSSLKGRNPQGRMIFGLGMPEKETIYKISTNFLRMQPKDQRSIKYAKDMIDKEYAEPMTASEIDSLKASFLVYIVSTLLAPGAKFDYVSVDYWNAIKEPTTIGEYDWSEYALEKVMDGVVKIKSDIDLGAKSLGITGCTLFL